MLSLLKLSCRLCNYEDWERAQCTGRNADWFCSCIYVRWALGGHYTDRFSSTTQWAGWSQWYADRLSRWRTTTYTWQQLVLLVEFWLTHQWIIRHPSPRLFTNVQWEMTLSCVKQGHRMYVQFALHIVHTILCLMRCIFILQLNRGAGLPGMFALLTGRTDMKTFCLNIADAISIEMEGGVAY